MKDILKSSVIGTTLAVLLSTGCRIQRPNSRTAITTILNRNESLPEHFQLRLDRDQAQALLLVIDKMQNHPLDYRILLDLTRELNVYLANAQAESRGSNETNTILDGDENGPTTIRVPTTNTDSYDGFRSVTQLSRTDIMYLRQFVLAYISSNQLAFNSSTRNAMSSLEQTDCYIIPHDPEREEQTPRWDRGESTCISRDLNEPSYTQTYGQMTVEQRRGMLNLFHEFSTLLTPDTDRNYRIPLHVADVIRLVISNDQVHYSPSTPQTPSTARIEAICSSIFESTNTARINAAIPTATSSDHQAATTTESTWDASHLSIAEVSLLRTILEAYVVGNSVSDITVPNYHLDFPRGQRVSLPGYFHFNARHRLHILYAIAALRRIEGNLIADSRN